MQTELLNEIIVQNRLTSSYSLDKITNDNKEYRLNADAASVRFIYRHIGELMNIFGHFFGVPTGINNTTMGPIFHCKRQHFRSIREVADGKKSSGTERTFLRL
jgi:hypothetical protein